MESATATAVDGGRPASMHMASLTDRFWRFMGNQHINTPVVYMELCISLARGIDHAIANNEVPARSCRLPSLLRAVQKCKSFLSFQAAFMVLMLSIKSACKLGWFPDKETDDLLLLAKEVQGVFSSAMDINIEPSDVLTYVSTVMSRFYPLMKLDKILVSLQTKPGYAASLADFHISRNMVDTQKEKIRLLVARTDNMNTSSCIISPPEVNFLLNGNGVQGRTNISVDNKPQRPTNVTGMLRNGTNLLQAIGKFDGSYIIALATISGLPSSGMELQDYDQSVLSSVDFDSDFMETSSVASLNCPISQRRIKVPVKGQVCKHYQCFDYKNYVAMNSRRPLWRCPYCNLSVCHLDLRIDQNTAKVLREVGEDVVRVVVSKDGSWKPVVEKEDISSIPSPVLPNATFPSSSQECGSDQRSRPSTTPVYQNRLSSSNNMHLHQPSVRSSSATVEGQQFPSMGSSDNRSQTAARHFVSQHQVLGLGQMTRNIGMFTSPGSSSHPRSASSSAANVNGYDRGTKRGEHSPGSHVNTSQAHNPALSFMQHQLFNHNHHYSTSQAVQSRMAHPSQDLAGASDITYANLRDTLEQAAHRHSQAMKMFQASQNMEASSPRNGLHRQTWSTQASGPSQIPVNTPVPGPVNLLQRRDSFHQPTMVNKATSPSQNPVVSPLIKQPAQVERSSGTQLPPSAAYTSSMVDQRLRSERERAENSPAPAVASDSDWRPSKRMRGSLTGEAYSAALSQFLSPPPPQQPVVRPPRPPPGFLPKLPVVSPLSGIAASQVNASGTSPVEKNLPNP